MYKTYSILHDYTTIYMQTFITATNTSSYPNMQHPGATGFCRCSWDLSTINTKVNIWNQTDWEYLSRNIEYINYRLSFPRWKEISRALPCRSLSPEPLLTSFWWSDRNRSSNSEQPFQQSCKNNLNRRYTSD